MVAAPVPAYLRPTSADDAVQLLLLWPDAAPIGGGTLAMSRMMPRRPDALIDLTCAGLDAIAVSATGREIVTLGATVTPAQLADPTTHAVLQHPALAGLVAAAQRFAPAAVARQATLGGNLATGIGSLLAPLLVLDTHAVVHGPDGSRRAPLAPLRLQSGELVSAIEFVLPSGNVQSASLDLRRTTHGPALVTMAALIVDVHVRLAVGGAEGPARRLREVDAPLASRTLAQWGDAVAHALRPLGDPRGSADYRRAMAAVLTRRLLTPLWEDR